MSSLRSATVEAERLTCTGEAAYAAAVSVRPPGAAQPSFYVADAAGVIDLQAKGEWDVHYSREEQWLASPADRRRLRIVTMDFVLAFFTDYRNRAPRAQAHVKEIEHAQTRVPYNDLGDQLTTHSVWGLYWIEDVGRRIDLGFAPRPSATYWSARSRNGVTSTSTAGAAEAIANLRAKEERASAALAAFLGGSADLIGDPPASTPEEVD